jgi:hypothetical protein
MPGSLSYSSPMVCKSCYSDVRFSKAVSILRTFTLSTLGNFDGFEFVLEPYPKDS